MPSLRLSSRRVVAAQKTKPNKTKTAGDKSEIVGSSLPIQETMRRARKMARSRFTVLLLGEPGTGKELFARFLDRESGRTGIFIPVNCSALRSELAAAELFGHEKGAFTGATSGMPGVFQAAEGGTVFLDEVGELDLETQAMLLRVLQERKVRRVRSNKEEPVNVRVIAATNQDLEAMVADRRFRADLLERLREYIIRIPPLRERGADVVAIARRFLRCLEAPGGSAYSLRRDAEALLVQYDWPGNVRELQNVLRDAALESRGRRIGATHIRRALGSRAPDGPVDPPGKKERVLRLIEGSGRARARDLRQKAALSHRGIHDAINSLIADGSVVLVGEGARTEYSLSEPASDAVAVSGLSADELAILTFVGEVGAAGRQEIVERVGFSVRSATRFCARLVSDGLLETVGGGKYLKYQLTDAGRLARSIRQRSQVRKVGVWPGQHHVPSGACPDVIPHEPEVVSATG